MKVINIVMVLLFALVLAGIAMSVDAQEFRISSGNQAPVDGLFMDSDSGVVSLRSGVSSEVMADVVTHPELDALGGVVNNHAQVLNNHESRLNALDGQTPTTIVETTVINQGMTRDIVRSYAAGGCALSHALSGRRNSRNANHFGVGACGDDGAHGAAIGFAHDLGNGISFSLSGQSFKHSSPMGGVGLQFDF